jgi:hypothetical protein
MAVDRGRRDCLVATEPPGFPDRWIEVRAEISGQEIERNTMLNEIDTMLASLTFEP